MARPGTMRTLDDCKKVADKRNRPAVNVARHDRISPAFGFAPRSIGWSGQRSDRQHRARSVLEEQIGGYTGR
jgi:hypothetical protein